MSKIQDEMAELKKELKLANQLNDTLRKEIERLKTENKIDWASGFTEMENISHQLFDAHERRDLELIGRLIYEVIDKIKNASSAMQ